MTNDSFLRSSCRVVTNIGDDCFVGIHSESGRVEICFPIGFHLSETEEGLRRDVKLLLTTLARGKTVHDGSVPIVSAYLDSIGDFPFADYLAILDYYFSYGYYVEKETKYHENGSGVIDWKRTIKRFIPYPQNSGSFVYLDFVKRMSAVNDSGLITLINKYCVRKSFLAIGWLFTDYIPPKDEFFFNRDLSIALLNEKLSSTFNETNRRLFQAMKSVILNESDNPMEDVFWGTYRFDRLWELMIDDVYGIGSVDKHKFFPGTKWNLRIGNTASNNNASLIPDTIMYLDNEVYVLDAKYYHYCQTGNVSDLPSSSDINKQVSYGEYADEHHPDGYAYDDVYNAFLLPFDMALSPYTDDVYLNIGEATCTWQRGHDAPYAHVQGVLIDTKTLMGMSADSKIQQKILKNAIRNGAR